MLIGMYLKPRLMRKIVIFAVKLADINPGPIAEEKLPGTI